MLLGRGWWLEDDGLFYCLAGKVGLCVTKTLAKEHSLLARLRTAQLSAVGSITYCAHWKTRGVPFPLILLNFVGFVATAPPCVYVYCEAAHHTSGNGSV